MHGEILLKFAGLMEIMKIMKISLGILIILTLTLILYPDEKSIQRNLLSHQIKENIDETNNCEKQDSNKSADKTVKDIEMDSYRRLYVMLNNEAFYQKFVKIPEAVNTESEIEKMLENNFDKFGKKEYSSDIFPASLVDQMQEILYYSCVNYTESAEYCDIELLDEFKSKQYELSKEESIAIFQEEAEHYDGIFRFFLDDNREIYLFRFDMGGSEGEYYITLKEKNGNELNKLTSFGTSPHAAGKVIKYQANYYYVFFEHNYNLKCNDGIRIYRLNENAKEENILIRYIPKEYTWKNLYTINNSLVNEYVESVQDRITSEEYIERGARHNYYNMLVGDETEDIAFPLTEEYKKYYKVDFTNTGTPVYIYKTTYEPSNAYSTICLKFSFYLWNREEKEILEFDALNYNLGSKTANGLVQMWFKEFNGKIYTFQLYSTGNFRYMLNVLLVEEDRITPVRADYILPNRTIVIEDEKEWKN